VTRMNANDTVCAALFASPLQPSDAPTAETIARAIGSTIRRLGAVRCTGHVAEEFGEHPEEAANRMRWIRRLTDELHRGGFLPTTVPATTATAGTDLLPVQDAA
jgi:hypothetical protein